MNSLDTCTSSRPRSPFAARLLTAATILGSAGCTLVSIDPDTLLADESDSDEIGQDEEGTADTGVTTNEGSDESSQDNEDTGDTAADETSSDEGTTEGNDTDTGTEEDTSTDGDTSSDSDASTTDTGETADPMCEASGDVMLGQNPVDIVDGMSSYEGSCGGVDSETLYWFTAPAGGDYYFTLSAADFPGVLYLFDDTCAEIADSCSNSGDTVSKTMSGGETVVVVVDSGGGSGTGTLMITGP